MCDHDRPVRRRPGRAILRAGVLWVPFVAACTLPGGGARDRQGAAALDLAAFEMVDLTHPFGDRTLYWPTSPTRFEVDTLAYGMTPDTYFYSAFAFSAPEHGGTHLDAPIHFARGGLTADAIPLEQLIAPAVVIDIAERAGADPDHRLTAEEVLAWEAEHGTIRAGSIVLLRTGWSRFWPEASAYLGDDTPGDASNLHFPSYGEEAARLLVQERRVAALGVDVASIDSGQSADFIVHRVAAEAGVPGLENLTNLDRLPATGATLIALPMRIEGGTGAPLRAVALVPRAP